MSTPPQQAQETRTPSPAARAVVPKSASGQQPSPFTPPSTLDASPHTPALKKTRSASLLSVSPSSFRLKRQSLVGPDKAGDIQDVSPGPHTTPTLNAGPVPAMPNGLVGPQSVSPGFNPLAAGAHNRSASWGVGLGPRSHPQLGGSPFKRFTNTKQDPPSMAAKGLQVLHVRRRTHTRTLSSEGIPMPAALGEPGQVGRAQGLVSRV